MSLRAFEHSFEEVRARGPAWLNDQAARFERAVRMADVDGRPATQTVARLVLGELSFDSVLTEIIHRPIGDEPSDSPLASEAAAAFRYARALAVLPTDAEHEALVDGLVDARIRGVSEKRPIRRGP